ncbi:MAG: hypothetical protein K5859_03530 [Atopobiaceae bacterium]|nr:hypothetical protein [Atopobiaceae bacterium]
MMKLEELEDEIYGLSCAIGSLQANMKSRVHEHDHLDHRIREIAHIVEGMLLEEADLRSRIESIERKLNHKGAE